MLWLPRSAVALSPWKTPASKIILHLTRDNIAALTVIAALNVLGADLRLSNVYAPVCPH